MRGRQQFIRALLVFLKALAPPGHHHPLTTIKLVFFELVLFIIFVAALLKFALYELHSLGWW